MSAAAMSDDDAARVAVLQQLGLDALGQDPELDRLTALVSQVLDVPMCVISLADGQDTRFVSRHGVASDHWPRQQSFCSQVIRSGRAVLAHDLRLDDRFADHELVSRRVPPVRFYAGMSLLLLDQVVASLAVMDFRPRPDFDQQRVRHLAAFAEMAQAQLLQTGRRLREQREHELYADGPMAAIVWDTRLPPRALKVSANAAEILGAEAAAALRAGTPLVELVLADDREQVDVGLSAHQMGDLPKLALSFRLARPGRRPRWIHQVSRAERDAGGRLIAIRSYLYDLTRQKQLEASIEATKNRLYLALESAHIGTWEIHIPSKERVLSARAAAMLGQRQDELDPHMQSWFQWIHPHDRVKVEQAMQAHRERSAEMMAIEYRIQHRQGHYIWVRSHSRVVEEDAQGRPARLVGTLIDITDEKEKEGLRNRQRQLLDLLNQAQSSFLLNRSVHEACEALFAPLLQISECELGFIGMVQHASNGQVQLLLPTWSPADWLGESQGGSKAPRRIAEGLLFPDLDHLFGEAIASNAVVLEPHLPSHHTLGRVPQGRDLLSSFLGLPIRFDHRVVGMIGLGNRRGGFDDQLVHLLEPLLVTLGTLFHAREQERARVNAEQELLRLASRDALTGLPNRRHFFEMAEAALLQTRRYGTPLSVAVLDLDHFKHINDTHGHAGGDAVLKVFADILRESLRDSDTPARIGGEEFAVLLTSTSLEESLTALERIRAALDRHAIELGAQCVFATVSIGAVQWRAQHLDVDSMLVQADQALYHAKRQGRNRVVLYADHLEDEARAAALRAANDAD